uniref:SAP domain-containing protein n=1 Tax=viral metagenome TaxID=1070528 RepID=A0A6C0AY50_9ZZZZ|tara:strand:- start:155 stop:847 length:693 start_codon:yes stop_codon:yes gene_type:complete
MNYIIENNIDFYSELQKELSKDSNQKIHDDQVIPDNLDNICLLSNSVLEKNYVTLECGHKFNYVPLYNEICNQKRENRLEITHLLINQIKCPYCRSITNKLLPYIDDKDVIKKKGINYPLKYCMKLHSCQWVKSGKNKDQELCGKSAFESDYGKYCCYHHKLSKNKNHHKEKLTNIQLNWSKEHERINKKYNLNQLREILRENKSKYKLKITGNKNEIIDRIIQCGLVIE